MTRRRFTSPKPLGNLLLNYSEGNLFSYHVLPFIGFRNIRESIYLVSKRVATLIQNASTLDFTLFLDHEMVRKLSLKPLVSKMTGQELFPSLLWFANGVEIITSNNVDIMHKNLLISRKIYESAFQAGKKLKINFHSLHGYKLYMEFVEKYKMANIRMEFTLSEMPLLKSAIRTIANTWKKYGCLTLNQAGRSLNAINSITIIIDFLKEENIFELFEKVEMGVGDEILNFNLNESNCSILSHLHEAIQFKCIKIELDDNSKDIKTKVNLNAEKIVIQSNKRNYLPNNFPQLIRNTKLLEMENICQKFSIPSCKTFNLLPNLLSLSKLDLRLCKLSFLEDGLTFEMPNLSTLSIKECIIKVKKEKDDSTRMLKMFKTPLLSELIIENMNLKNIPLGNFPKLKILKLDNNYITGDLTDFERLSIYYLDLLSISYNLISKFQTYNNLCKVATKVIALGNVLDAIVVNGEIKEFTEEYHIERDKYFQTPINWVPSQNSLSFFRTHTAKIEVDKNYFFKDLLTHQNLFKEDPNLLFWNFLYSKPPTDKKTIMLLSGFIQLGIKLNSQWSKRLGRNWIFVGFYLASTDSVRCTLLDGKRFEPSQEYIIHHWSFISSQHEHVNKLRR